MENLEIKIGLCKLEGAKYISVNGQKGVFIPDDNPSIYVGKKDVYLTVTAVGKKEVGQDGQTHFLKPTMPAEKYKDMSQEEKSRIPIIGNVRPIGRKAIQPEEPMQVVNLRDMPQF